MARAQVEVRRAGAADVDDLLVLWASAREEVPGPARAATAHLSESRDDVTRDRLTTALASGEVQVLLAREDASAIGYLLMRTAPLLPLTDGEVVQIEHLHVESDHRRRGVGHALLVAATSFAEQTGAETVACSAAPAARDVHRFLARLGFVPLVTRRVVSTAALRRRLGGESRRSALEEMLSRRSSLRRRVRPDAAGVVGGPS